MSSVWTEPAQPPAGPGLTGGFEIATSSAIAWSLRRSLAGTGGAHTDVHLLLCAARFHDERHAGRVLDPVPPGISEPAVAAGIGAVGHDEAVTGGGRCPAPSDAEPV